MPVARLCRARSHEGGRSGLCPATASAVSRPQRTGCTGTASLASRTVPWARCSPRRSPAKSRNMATTAIASACSTARVRMRRAEPTTIWSRIVCWVGLPLSSPGPVRWGETGVMTFMVSHNSDDVYEEGSRPRHGTGGGGDQRLQSRQVMGQGGHDAVVRRRALLPPGFGFKVGYLKPCSPVLFSYCTRHRIANRPRARGIRAAIVLAGGQRRARRDGRLAGDCPARTSPCIT